jgi:hypothetical protein
VEERVSGKKVKSTVRFGPAIKATLICLVTCSLGLGYVWQKQQINSLGELIKESEIKLEQLKRENKSRKDTLAFLMSPQELDARLRQLDLSLQVPPPERIRVIVEQGREERAMTDSASTESASIHAAIR